ncbi:MAG: lipoxygenase family protein [Crocinitomicaceae bacterium]|nr:lipoxygenase family protein [Crocinitomicaceae bacterium]
METWKIVLIIVGVLALLVAAYFIIKTFVREVTKVRHLNLHKRGLTEMPAVPFILTETIASAVKLNARAQQNKMAKEGLNHEYTLDNQTRSSYTFMYDTDEVDPGKKDRDALIHRLSNTNESVFLNQSVLKKNLEQAAHESEVEGVQFNQLFLEHAEQFSISWTNFGGLRSASMPNEKKYASILTDPDAASEQFWPMISNHGLAYNLLILQKVNEDSAREIKDVFSSVWDEIAPAYDSSKLFAIDLRIFSKWDASQVKNYDRWTPGSFILLEQNPTTKKLTPIAVQVCGKDESKAKIYTRKTTVPSTWIWALTAARTSVTVYGIWLGHVYHWHIVSAPMQMTLFNEVKESHPLRKLLDPQSKSLIGFDAALLLLWKTIGPPTSFSSPELFLELTNEFATGRNFFDDDPLVTLKKFGITEDEFSFSEPWDQYPIAGDLLKIWKLSETFADSFVNETYSSDKEIFDDTQLQNWMKQSTNPAQGNVRGLPNMENRDDLKAVLSSLIYRVAAHGNSRQLNSLSDALCFVANYPPCLQHRLIPEPMPSKEKPFAIKDVLGYLPNTGTIGEMMTFYFIFTYSVPYNPLIPLFGVREDLYFDDPTDPRNLALIAFREGVQDFIEKYDPEAPMTHQWPASIET